LAPPKENVARFDIPVNQASLLMGELQRRSDTHPSLENLPFGNFARFIHPLLKARFVQVFHDQIEASFLLPESENPYDIRVSQGCGDFNFFEEFSRKLGVGT